MCFSIDELKSYVATHHISDDVTVTGPGGLKCTLLQTALFTRSHDAIELLLKHGANANITPTTESEFMPLAIVAGMYTPKDSLRCFMIAQMLMKCNANPNVPSMCLIFRHDSKNDEMSKHAYCCTPLWLACEYDNVDLVRLLLKGTMLVGKSITTIRNTNLADPNLYYETSKQIGFSIRDHFASFTSEPPLNISLRRDLHPEILGMLIDGGARISHHKTLKAQRDPMILISMTAAMGLHWRLGDQSPIRMLDFGSFRTIIEIVMVNVRTRIVIDGYCGGLLELRS
jgi:ankyrin repeat protein